MIIILQKKYKIYYSDKFYWKVSQIRDYIFYKLQNPIASYNFKIKLKKTISILNYFPQAGPKFLNTEYRYLILNHWLILYKIQNNIVKISEIISSKQDLSSIY